MLGFGFIFIFMIFIVVFTKKMRGGGERCQIFHLLDLFAIYFFKQATSKRDWHQ